MSDVNQQLEMLIKLQEMDCELDKVKADTDNNPELINEKKEKLLLLKTEGEDKKKNLLDLQKSKKEKEIELETRESDIKKHSMELNAVKTNNAYKALLAEIEGAKADKSVLEDDILKIMDEIDKASVFAKSVDGELKIKEQEINAEISKIEEETKKLNAEYESAKAKRDEFARGIDQNLVSKYDHIRQGRDGIAVAALDGENCGGCSCVLRPQTINEIIKGKEIVICDNCSRIIYKKHES